MNLLIILTDSLVRFQTYNMTPIPDFVPGWDFLFRQLQE